MSTQYRYPGINPFTKEQKDLFFGREKDTEKFLELLQLEQMIVLYSKSGIGKSSLINAGVVPKLEDSSDSLPITLRFGAYNEQEKQTPLEIIKRKMSPQKPEFTYLDKILLNENSLWYHCKNLQKNSPDIKQIVLIFDQFEELFTYPHRDLAYFKDELADLLYSKIPANFREMLKDKELRDSLTDEEQNLLYEPLTVKVVFAIRSDKMSEMDKLKDRFQTILRNTYELQPLNTQQARDAIVNPAKKEGDFYSEPFDYSEDVINCILGFLTQKGRNIESFQLQFICQYIENKVIDEKIKIVQPGHIEKELDKVVDDFYQQAIEKIDTDDQGTAQRITQALIHKDNRISRFKDVLIDDYHADEKLLDRLVNTRLLRAEPNYEGKIYYELAHDTLIEPVRKAKEKRLQEEELRKERKKRKRQEERKRNLRIIGIVSIAAIISIIFAVFGFWQWDKAEKALKEVDIQKVKAEEALDKFLAEQQQRKKAQIDQMLRNAESYIVYNEYELAIEELQKALEIDSTNVQVKQKLEEYRERLE